VFELIGATSASVLAYILPPLCYLKLATKSWRSIPAILCICFGFIVMGVSIVTVVGNLIQRKLVFFLLEISSDRFFASRVCIEGRSANMLTDKESEKHC
jgi:Transmembrane amino acid transporter protein